MQAFLGVPRKILSLSLDSDFPDDLTTAAVYLYLANRANWCDGIAPVPGQKEPLKTGQLVSGQRELARRTGFSHQSIRTSLERLTRRGKINTLANTRGTIITIIDYATIFLKSADDQHTDQHTSNTPATHQQHLQDKETKRQRDKKTLLSPDADDGAWPGQEIASAWNNTCGSLPKAVSLSAERKKKLRARWEANPDVSYWETCIRKLAASSFAANGSWATIDWLIKNDTNHRKAQEGNYDDKRQTPNFAGPPKAERVTTRI